MNSIPVAQRSWQHDELQRELNWFNHQLDVPGRFFYRLYRRGERSGICWFRDSARLHIARARYMAWLIEELGLPIRHIRTDNPGAILWSDDAQVVALPQAQA